MWCINGKIKFPGLTNFHGENLLELNPGLSKPSPDPPCSVDVSRWLLVTSDMSDAADAARRGPVAHVPRVQTPTRPSSHRKGYIPEHSTLTKSINTDPKLTGKSAFDRSRRAHKHTLNP